ncbi:Isochorismatase-like protein [Phyllosticta citrichinensis]|uniref:Isochorismatase-like protein n=1 Tax=Phyllosticta citrichinensis TaxID=1130410 RepID=A0ABR1XKK8_9PEZI
MQRTEHRRAVIGNADNFWLFSSQNGFDLTHPTEHGASPRLNLKTTTSPITLSPAKTALVIIDMQIFFLSEAFGRSKGPGHAAAESLVNNAIPAARKAGVRVVWLNWGLTDEDVKTMPPAVKRAFGFEAFETVPASPFEEQPNGIAVDKFGDTRHLGGSVLLENGKDGRIYCGLGSPCGTVVMDSGKQVDAGRLLMRDTWNAALFPPLDEVYRQGSRLPSTPDVRIHKNRMSGMWGQSSPLEEFLEDQGIRTLLFAGVNTDQCVSGTLTDAFSKGYDCVLLGDGAGTSSPGFSQECIEYNAAKTWGFLSSTADFARAVDEMGPRT